MKIVIDGNIGCGKSTLIQKLKDYGITVYGEPVEEWTEWLKLFYNDPKSYSFGFQLQVLKSHLKNGDKSKEGVFERSPLSCQKVFGEILYETGNLKKIEMELLNDFINSFGWIPHKVFYLRCNPQVCFDRIQERNRDGEDLITLEYLDNIHNKYEQLYYYNDTNFIVHTIDANNSIDIIFNEIINELLSRDNIECES